MRLLSAGVCTGKVHAGLYCNDPQLEGEAHAAGLASGDMAFPML